MSPQMRIRECNLRSQVALRGADVDERAVVLPGKAPRDRHVGAVADPGHRREKVLQPSRIGVERLRRGPARRP